MITDTHAHVWWDAFDSDRRATLERARDAGVSRIVLVGTDAATSRRSFELCDELKRAPIEGLALYPTAGIHPHDAAGTTEVPSEAARTAVAELCRHSDCVAVGETGLDFFKEYSPRATQEQSFRWHLDLARELDLPVVVHSRAAHPRTAALLAEYPGVRGVMHCYTMGPDELPAYLDCGLHISFSGVVTYPKNDANRAAGRAVPPDRLLVETDCPFLAPQGHRGRRNEPALVLRVLETLAQQRNVALEELAALTSANAAALFGLR